MLSRRQGCRRCRCWGDGSIEGEGAGAGRTTEDRAEHALARLERVGGEEVEALRLCPWSCEVGLGGLHACMGEHHCVYLADMSLMGDEMRNSFWA